MNPAVLAFYEAYPDPSPQTCPIGPAQLDRIDDNLHFGWAWHRYRYCYRRPDRLRILDAGCGTGLTTLGLARLNPGSTVLGLDASPRSLELARLRAAVHESENLAVEFRSHDLETPLPGSLGPFDFIVCRGVLHQVDNPVQVLENLARRLDARGLLLATFPSQAARHTIRQFRRAVDALAGDGMDLADRAKIAQELFQAFRRDHPIRAFERETQGLDRPSLDRIKTVYLNEAESDWTLESALATVERAGLQFLYAPPRRPWQPALVFNKSDVPDGLKARVEGSSDRVRAILMDALDPTLNLETYRHYACLPEFEPRVPGWPEERQQAPDSFDRLIPHLTHLARPAELVLDTATSRGNISYRVVTGAIGEIDWTSDALLRSVDDQKNCGQIDQRLQALTGVVEVVEARQFRWLNLANTGFVALESPDPRQHVDCQHLGPIRDRLDCPCPRRWIRACARHGYCTIDMVGSAQVRQEALSAALNRLGLASVVSCSHCPDYVPDE